jgi:exonuclease III
MKDTFIIAIDFVRFEVMKAYLPQGLHPSEKTPSHIVWYKFYNVSEKRTGNTFTCGYSYTLKNGDISFRNVGKHSHCVKSHDWLPKFRHVFRYILQC